MANYSIVESGGTRLPITEMGFIGIASYTRLVKGYLERILYRLFTGGLCNWEGLSYSASTDTIYNLKGSEPYISK